MATDNIPCKSTESKEVDIDPLVEWAVWGHLSRETDLELILLKGHLLIEVILSTVLSRNGITAVEDFSFHRKISELGKMPFKEENRLLFLINALRLLNSLRNRLAHEFHFKVDNGEFESWSMNILDNLKGMKYTKFTRWTKIVHSFSVLAINILELGK